jgi:hypothetical protein
MPTQVTLVSVYGEKNKDLAVTIAQWQELVAKAVGSAFTPYDMHQIHATIIGCERHRAPAYNANFSKHRGREVEMDFAGFLAYLRGCGHIPFEVQLGGFADRDYPFTSRKARPYERAFSIQGDKVVVMGWPVRGEPLPAPPATPAGGVLEARIYPATLDIIRHAAQAFGILHSYHRAVTDVDNDLFFRIGLIDTKAVTSATTSALETQARKLLSMQRPVVVEIGLENIFVTAYEDDRLPVSSTRTWSLADRKVDGEFAASLFT